MKSNENKAAAASDRARELATGLLSAPARFALTLTGGGGGALAWITARPGASRILVEGTMPYDNDVLARRLGRVPASAVSADVAEALAVTAQRRAARRGDDGREPIGVACTAALATDRDRRGDEQAFLTAVSSTTQWTVSLHFHKGNWDRQRQEEAVALEVLHLMARAAGTEGPPPAEEEGLEREEARAVARGPLTVLARGDVPWVRVRRDGRVEPSGSVGPVLLPGSFNPLHAGHLGMAEAAEQLLGLPVALELAQTNADKPDQTVTDLRRRIESIHGIRPLVVTRAGTFPEKATLFPGRWFVVGMDTATRLVDPRFYGGDAGLGEALVTLVRNNARFLVAARSFRGELRRLEDLSLPTAWADRCRAIPPEIFLENICSTDLRQGRF